MNQQITRLFGVFLVAGSGLAAARHYLIPPTFGELGHYRAAAIDLMTARKSKFAGPATCAECHDEIAAKRASGNHRTLSCEVCHGPSALHATDLEPNPVIPQPRKFCPVCHAYDPSRPTGFAQIDPVGHNPLKACTKCHDPHAPVPPVVPEECTACHGQIARTKASSKHVRLPCTTCHDAPQQHKITPRAVRPTKPEDRSTCLRCHSQPDTTKQNDAPQIDDAAHNPRYLCWDCHYPHNPRAQ
jgi:hypothetical protein